MTFNSLLHTFKKVFPALNKSDNGNKYSAVRGGGRLCIPVQVRAN